MLTGIILVTLRTALAGNTVGRAGGGAAMRRFEAGQVDGVNSLNVTLGSSSLNTTYRKRDFVIILVE